MASMAVRRILCWRQSIPLISISLVLSFLDTRPSVAVAGCCSDVLPFTGLGPSAGAGLGTGTVWLTDVTGCWV